MKKTTLWFNDWLDRQIFLIWTLEWMIATITLYIIIMATRDIIGPIALLFESLENLFRGIVKAVDEQYTKSNVDFTGEQPQFLFRLLRGPLPTVIFIHLTIILMNAICILFGLLFRAEYFMKCNMFILISLLIADAAVFLTWIYKDPKTSVGMFLDELQRVQIQYLGAETNNFPTLLFNYVHQHFHCCGMNDYTEWLNSTIKWKRMVTYDNITYEIKIPISCCPNLTNDRLPDCARLNSNYPPFIQGCGEILTYNPIFDTTSISERFYTLVYFVAHIITISLYVVKTTLLKQKSEILFLYHEGKLQTNNEEETYVNNNKTLDNNNNNNNNNNDIINTVNEQSIATNTVRGFGYDFVKPHKNDSHFY
ncbi:unnamed protein product [Schistosoma haematobium]|nr:unnamed protein product [Schistosoma haematobium]